MVSRRWILSGLFAGAGAGAIAYKFWPEQPEPERFAPTKSLNPVIRPARGLQYIVTNAQTGDIILEQNANVRRQPASLTKVMALALVYEALSDPNTNFHLDTEVPIPEYINRVGRGIAVFENLRGQESAKARDLLIGAGSRSDAYSTLALALHLGAPEVYDWGANEDIRANSFLALMNQKAQEIGMHNSNFSVMTGLPNPDNISTPHDISILMRYVRDNFPNSAELSLGQPTFDISDISASTTHSSRLLRSRPREILFAKTGWTNAAGFCLSVLSERNRQQYIGTVFGAQDRAHRNEVMINILDQAETMTTQNRVTFSTSGGAQTLAPETSIRPTPRPPRR